MIKRYIDLYPILPTCGFGADVLEYIPTAAEHASILELFDDLKFCEELNKVLQTHDHSKITLAFVRKSFDRVIQKFPDMSHHLAADADIVHCPDFENAIVKLQSFEEHRLTNREKAALKNFKTYDDEAVEDEPHQEGGDLPWTAEVAKELDEELHKRQRKTLYRPVNHISPTTAVVERLFSRAGLIMTPSRRSMDPSTLETLLMLITNKDMWNVHTVDEAITRFREAGDLGDADD
jgi:hypothetical protein